MRAKEIIAISRAKFLNVANDKVADFVSGKIMPLNQARPRQQSLQNRLSNEIKTRGDKRIQNPDNVAEKFFAEVEQGNRVIYSGSTRPWLEYLKQLDIEENDLTPEMLLGEVVELAEFRGKLRVANNYLNIPWPELKQSVTKDRIPSWIIESSLKKYGQDLPERKGSELNDNHLACLAAYADLTYVDKRTNENFRRALEKETMLGRLVKRIEKATSYEQIIHDLISHQV